MPTGFDCEKYLKLQSEELLKRIKNFDNKLYIEFGGKLYDDYHASRVLPGFDPNIKIKLLEKLKDKLEVIFCISADDIENNKVRDDFGITYDMEVLRIIEKLREKDISINSVVITLYTGQPAANLFADKLTSKKQKVYFHTYTKGYPTDVDTIVSPQGYGANPYIKTTKPLVVVTAPGSKSGKLGTCLSQLYQEYQRGIKAGYVKFETFPVWNLPLKHMVNVAYEAATANIKDVNMIDPYHYSHYGKIAVNYNRDIAVFPVLQDILHKITGNKSYYNSPTDMGINNIGNAITDDAIVSEAAKQEIIRRYYRALAGIKKGCSKKDDLERIELLLNEHDILKTDRKVVKAANDYHQLKNNPVVALQLADGTILTGQSKDIMTACAAATLNAIKYLSKLPAEVKLISEETLIAIKELKRDYLKNSNGLLTIKDVLIALSLNSRFSDVIKIAMQKLSELNGCEAHSTFILSPNEESAFKNLGINITSEPVFINNKYYLN